VALDTHISPYEYSLSPVSRYSRPIRSRFEPALTPAQSLFSLALYKYATERGYIIFGNCIDIDNLIFQSRSFSPTEIKSPSLTHVIPGSEPVVSLASLKNKLFVIRSPHRQHIEVYSTLKFDLQRLWHLECLNDHKCQLASCETNNCLYVSDRNTDTVYKVNATSAQKPQIPARWRVGSGPVGLSVNRERNVLVTCDGANAIEEYTPRGTLVRRVGLAEPDYSLWHAVELSNGHYAVSYSDPVQGVSVLTRRGRLVFTSGNDQKSKTRLLIGPRYLAVGANDCILVADKDNDRILALNFSLTRAQDLKLSVDGGLEGPYCLHLDDSRGRLYVGEYDGKRTLVFDNVVNTSVRW